MIVLNLNMKSTLPVPDSFSVFEGSPPKVHMKVSTLTCTSEHHNLQWQQHYNGDSSTISPSVNPDLTNFTTPNESYRC